MKTILRIVLATLALTLASRAGIVTNGGFESGLAGWRPLWTREAGAGSLNLDARTLHGGRFSTRIEHAGGQDWSLEPARRVSVQPGDVFELEAWLKLESRGRGVTLCVATCDARGTALDWSHGGRSRNNTADWERVQTRFIVPPGVAEIQPRLIGSGPLIFQDSNFFLCFQFGRDRENGLICKDQSVFHVGTGLGFGAQRQRCIGFNLVPGGSDPASDPRSQAL